MGRFQKRLITVAALCLVVTGKVCAQTLHYDKPAVFFEEALVIGNGTRQMRTKAFLPSVKPYVRAIMPRPTRGSTMFRDISRRTISRWDSLP